MIDVVAFQAFWDDPVWSGGVDCNFYAMFVPRLYNIS